jgi:hypothetical protein
MNAILKEKMNAIVYEYDLDNYEDEIEYENYLNEEGDIFIAGLNFSPSEVLKKCDSIAYNEGFSNWVDSLPEKYLCPICDEEYEDEDDAVDCCQEDIWMCNICNKEFFSEEEAEDCCSE